MTLDLQFKIKNNPNYVRYLREHSEWYKELNRNPNIFPLFEEQVAARNPITLPTESELRAEMKRALIGIVFIH